MDGEYEGKIVSSRIEGPGLSARSMTSVPLDGRYLLFSRSHALRGNAYDIG